MRIVVPILLALIAVIAAPANAQKKGLRTELIDAQKIIDQCWAISLEDRSSGNTQRHRAGHLETALCLEKAIVANASQILRGPEYTAENLKKKFLDLRFLYGRFYWDLNTNNRGCDPFCGTENNVTHNWELAKLYEGILKDVIEKRNRYRY